MLEQFFGLRAKGTSVRVELLAGLTTFLTMAYIIFVNPSILGDAGMPKDAVFVATCLAAALGSAVMALAVWLGPAIWVVPDIRSTRILPYPGLVASDPTET